MAEKVKLDICVASYPFTDAVLNGSIPIEGVEPNFIKVVPQIGAFRRMVRQVEFDVCEVAPTTYIIARAYGAPFVALPIFVMRRFHHGGFLVRPDKNIKHPKDLEGKKAGVRAYSLTTGVWTRGIFQTEYGLDDSKVTWVVDDEEHVTQMPLPSNVIHAAKGVSLADMMDSGELVAGFDGNAGIGRSGDPNSGTWKEIKQDYPELIQNVEQVEADWFKKTGIYPMHGTLTIKDSVLKANPWVARSLYNAFDQAKQDWLKKLKAGEATTATDKRYLKLMPVVGDPIPYGMEENLPTIKALEAIAFSQKLTPRRMAIDEIFVDPKKV